MKTCLLLGWIGWLNNLDKKSNTFSVFTRFVVVRFRVRFLRLNVSFDFLKRSESLKFKSSNTGILDSLYLNRLNWTMICPQIWGALRRAEIFYPRFAQLGLRAIELVFRLIYDLFSVREKRIIGFFDGWIFNDSLRGTFVCSY